MQILLTPTTLAIVLVSLFPAPSVHSEPPIVYSTVSPIKTLSMPSLPVYKPMGVESLPVAPVGTYANDYAPLNCTSYVASRVKVPDSWGNAADWAGNAAAAGDTVSATPVVGAIAQHGGGLGHVAVVLQVGDGQVLIAEQNYDYQGSIRQRWAATSEFTYIYL